MSTPSLRRPGIPLSSQTKVLITSATAALVAGYFVGCFAFGRSGQPVEVAVAPPFAIDNISVGPLSLREVEAPSAEASALAVESRAAPEVQAPSSGAAVRLEIQPAESGVDAKPPETP